MSNQRLFLKTKFGWAQIQLGRPRMPSGVRKRFYEFPFTFSWSIKTRLIFFFANEKIQVNFKTYRTMNLTKKRQQRLQLSPLPHPEDRDQFAQPQLKLLPRRPPSHQQPPPGDRLWCHPLTMVKDFTWSHSTTPSEGT